MTNEQLADKIIKELQGEGYTPDQMLDVITKAREIFNTNYRKAYTVDKRYIDEFENIKDAQNYCGIKRLYYHYRKR